MSEHTASPTVLIILDGFGHREDNDNNAIANAHAPFWQSLWAECPRTTIATSGMAVGLPEGQMGNSEVGHMTLGAGRVVYQNFTRINKAITDGNFQTNSVYCQAIDTALANDRAVHVMGLLSPGGVHSHEQHLLAMIKMAAARGATKIYLHAFLDGRDCPPRSAEPSLKKAEALFAQLGCGRIASVCGRFYAMDRDNRWERVSQAYRLLTQGQCEQTANSAQEALENAYQRDENDEFVAATAILDHRGNATFIEDGDAVLFMNFRPDRARQLAHCFTDATFSGFERPVVRQLSSFVQTTQYEDSIPAPIAFPPEELINSFGEVLANSGKRQLRIAETEKYAHVTFFFSGGQEALYPGEKRELIASPQVETYDLQPEMSAPEVTEKLVAAIRSGDFDAIVCNYANCDQVGHTGSYPAAVKAVEAVDEALREVISALREVGGQALITADHGNVESMYDAENDQPHTQHTTLPVPLVYVGPRQQPLSAGGSLADIAPTLLDLMGVVQPSEMSGRTLLS